MYINPKWVTPALVGVGSFIAGAASGYFFKKYRDSKPDIENLRAEVVDQDIRTEEVESHLTQLQFMYEERDRKYDLHIQQLMRAGLAYDKVIEEPEHVFAVEEEGQEWSEEDDEWDYDEEVESRSPDKPYVIHRDEYFSNEMGFEQSTLTYYKGDNILCDDLDVPVYQPEKVVGPLLFGHGSQDPSIVYIRNEQHRGEFEVLLEYGTFEEEILEQKVSKDLDVNHLKHSLMKFREE